MALSPNPGVALTLPMLTYSTYAPLRLVIGPWP